MRRFMRVAGPHDLSVPAVIRSSYIKRMTAPNLIPLARRVPAPDSFVTPNLLTLPEAKRPCKLACQWLVPRILNAYERTELLDKDQCATGAANIFSQAAKPELRGWFQ